MKKILLKIAKCEILINNFIMTVNAYSIFLAKQCSLEHAFSIFEIWCSYSFDKMCVIEEGVSDGFSL